MPSFADSNLNKKISELEKRLEKRPNDKELLTKVGILYYKNKEFKKSAKAFVKSIDDKDPRNYLYAAKAYRAQKAYLDEVRILNLMIPKNPNYPRGYVLLANALVHLEKLDEAIVKYRTAIEINPKYEEAYWGLYKVYEKKKNNYESRIILLDLLKSFGEKPRYLNPLCRLYSVDSFFEASIQYCQNAIRKDPKHADNHIYLALTYKFAKNQLQSEKIIKKAAEQFQQSELAQKTAGEIMLESENWEDAVNYYQDCVKINKESLDCQMGLGKAAFEIGKYKVSNEAFLKACRIDRSIVAEYKKRAAILRINKKKKWFNQFTTSIDKCY